MSIRRLAALVAAGVALLLAGCTQAHPAASASGSAATPAGPSRAAGAWQEPARYTFVLHRTCGEGPLYGLIRITVAGGAVVDAVGLDETGRQELRDGARAYLPTLRSLVQRVTDARGAGAPVANLTVDPADGHPTRIEIDPDGNAIDDELCFTVSGYHAG